MVVVFFGGMVVLGVFFFFSRGRVGVVVGQGEMEGWGLHFFVNVDHMHDQASSGIVLCRFCLVGCFCFV